MARKQTNIVRLLTLLATFFLFESAMGQTVSKTEEEKAYAMAIKEYLKATNKRDATVIDTLLIGKRPDFHTVSLPSRIENTTILFLTTKEVDKKRKKNKKLVFVNLAGTVTKNRSEFLFVTFYPGYTHQYDCVIGLKYEGTTRAFQLEDVSFKNYGETREK